MKFVLTTLAAAITGFLIGCYNMEVTGICI